MVQFLTSITVEDVVKFLTAALQLVTIILIARANRHLRTELEPKVDQVAHLTAQAASVVKRKLGDRDPSRQGTRHPERRNGES